MLEDRKERGVELKVRNDRTKCMSTSVWLSAQDCRNVRETNKSLENLAQFCYDTNKSNIKAWIIKSRLNSGRGY